MGGYVFAGVGMQVDTCLWTTVWRQFKSDCHQTLSFITLATGDKVIKFWKIKVGGGGMSSTERPSSLNKMCCYNFW